MNEQSIKELVSKYNHGIATPDEKLTVEQLIEQGLIQLDQLVDMETLHKDVLNLPTPSPSDKVDEKFYAMLEEEKKQIKPSSAKEFFLWPQGLMRIAAAVLLLITGVAIGRYFAPAPVQDNQVEHLTQEIGDLKEMMMLSLLEKDEATERLKAVSLSESMDAASTTVTNALIQTLNNDSNVNVRLAALEALKPYAHNSGIREQLVRSIAKQESPLVQISLAELMAALQEKSSVTELEKILKSEKTPEDVKKKIQETINVMI